MRLIGSQVVRRRWFTGISTKPADWREDVLIACAFQKHGVKTADWRDETGAFRFGSRGTADKIDVRLFKWL